MDKDKEKETAAFYERLQVELDNSNTWPAEYLFKFIVPSVDGNVKKVEVVSITAQKLIVKGGKRNWRRKCIL